MSEEQSPISPADGLASGAVLAVAFAVLGTIGAWVLTLAFHPVFAVPGELFDKYPFGGAEVDAAIARVAGQNATVMLAWSGAAIGIALALGEALARRSAVAAVLGIVVCGLAGALFGALSGWLAHAVGQAIRPISGPMPLYRTVAVQVVALGILGLGIGLGLGTVTGRFRGVVACVSGGALAGLLAGLVYPVAAALVAIFRPIAQSDGVMPPESYLQVLWVGMAAVLLGLILPGIRARRPKGAL